MHPLDSDAVGNVSMFETGNHLSDRIRELAWGTND